MSNRELEDKTAVIPALAGVNERTQKADLQVQEFVRIEGTFPSQTGHQQKLPGKVLLGKFDEAVYGIHQFWSPYGYGPNIYQFDGSISVDPWITPPGGPVTIPSLPPPSTWNENFEIIDEWGNPPNLPPTTGGPGVGYVGGTGNGTNSTPGFPPRTPPEPPPDFHLRFRTFFVAFPIGASLRNLRDILFIRMEPDSEILHIGSPDLSTVGDHTYVHPSGEYPRVTYTIDPQTPASGWESHPVGVNPANQGGYYVYEFYLSTNSASMRVVTDSWN